VLARGMAFSRGCQALNFAWVQIAMAMRRQLSVASFSAADIRILTAAYESALCKLNLKARDDPMTELIAAKIIQVYRLGEHDSDRLCSRAISELGFSPVGRGD
jgi:hypothetical protein